MFTCGECYAVCEGQEKHPNAPACDEFDGQEEEVQTDVYGDEVYTLKDARDEIDKLRDYARGIHAIVLEQQRQFDSIIAAIVKAAGPEEER